MNMLKCPWCLEVAFEEDCETKSLSILTSRLSPNGLRSKGLRQVRAGGGAKYSMDRLGVAADAALEDVG